MVTRDIAGARFVSRYHPRIVERARSLDRAGGREAAGSRERKRRGLCLRAGGQGVGLRGRQHPGAFSRLPGPLEGATENGSSSRSGPATSNGTATIPPAATWRFAGSTAGRACQPGWRQSSCASSVAWPAMASTVGASSAGPGASRFAQVATASRPWLPPATRHLNARSSGCRWWADAAGDELHRFASDAGVAPRRSRRRSRRGRRPVPRCSSARRPRHRVRHLHAALDLAGGDETRVLVPPQRPCIPRSPSCIH